MPVSEKDRLAAGELRQRISIIRPVGTQSATGGTVEGTPQTFAANLPAAVDSLPMGNEGIQAGQLIGSVTHRIRIRYLAGIKPWMTISYGSRTLQILSVDNLDERRLDVWLLCAEVL